MTAQFPPLDCAESQPGGAAARNAWPGWPRLMNERMAARYLSIGTTMLRDLLPPKKLRGRAVWDRRDLDRFADAIDGQPLDQGQTESHSRDLERRFLEQLEGEQ